MLLFILNFLIPYTTKNHILTNNMKAVPHFVNA